MQNCDRVEGALFIEKAYLCLHVQYAYESEKALSSDVNHRPHRLQRLKRMTVSGYTGPGRLLEEAGAGGSN